MSIKSALKNKRGLSLIARGYGGVPHINNILQDKRGLSLIEVVVSLMILMVVMLGLGQTILVSISNNMINLFRNEAVNIADSRLNGVLVDTTTKAHDGLRNMPYATLAALVSPDVFSVTRTFRGNASMTYTVTTTLTNISDPGGTITAEKVTITITWTYKNKQYTHDTMTVIRNAS